MTSSDHEEGHQPMTAQPVTPEEEVPFPLGPTGRPEPPAPTPEEHAAREQRWREERERAERERPSSSEQSRDEVIRGAKEALSRLIALEGKREALPPEQRHAGIPGVQYEYPDLTEDRIKAAKAAWNLDLDVVRGDDGMVAPLASWRVDEIEDPMAREAVRRFIEQLPRGKKRTCILFGSVGAGKTAVAVAAGYLAVERGIVARFISHHDYLSRLRPGGNLPDGLNAEQYRKRLRECQLLVLDDFCADMNVDAPATEHARRETMDLLNYRLHKGKPLIVTTNLTTEQVRTVMDDRIASRLGMNAVVVQMVERDRRKPVEW